MTTVLPKFSTDELVSKIREIAAANPDFIYADPESGNVPANQCRYTYGGEPSCLVGQALVALGVPADWFTNPLYRRNTCGFTRLASCLKKEGVVTDDNSVNIGWVCDVQNQQDDGASWGTAIELADQSYPKAEK